MAPRLRLIYVFCALAVVTGLAHAADSSKCFQSPATRVRLVAVAEDLRTLTVSDTSDYYKTTITGKEECSRITKTLDVPASDLRNTLKDTMKVQTGDYLNIEFADGKLSNVSFSRNLEPIPAGYRWALLFGTAFALFGLATLITAGHPFDLLIGKDNRYSNSQTQAAVWFWIVISSYVSTLVLRRLYAGPAFLGGIGIPGHLLLLSGLSAITFAGAKAIAVSKDGADKTVAPNIEPPHDPLPSTTQPGTEAAPIATLKNEPLKKSKPLHGRALKYLLADLTQDDDRNFDFGDFQLIVVMLIAVVTYIVVTFEFLAHIDFRTSVTLRDVDTTILSLFGLGQGAYLAKKAVSKPGEP